MPERSLITRAGSIGCCTAMVAAGALLSAYGPAIPAFQEHFGLAEAAAGAGLGVQSVGAVAGVLLAQTVLRLRGNRFTVGVSMALMGVGALAVAAAPTWPLLLLGAVVAGLGLGGCDSLITQLFIVGHGSRGPTMVNIAHACFGLGTVAAPLSAAGTGPAGYGFVFLGIAVLAFAGLAMVGGLVPRPTPAEVDMSTGGGGTGAAPTVGPALAVLGSFVALYLMHFGVQSGIGSWEPTFLLDLGHPASVAALATSGFWLAMVLGRFVAAMLVRVVRPSLLVVGSCAGLVAATALTFHPPAAVGALLLAGLFIGPIFPNGLTWLATTGHANGARFAYVIAASMVGSALAPVGFGAALAASGTGAFPAAVLIVAAATLAASIGTLLLARERREHRRPREHSGSG